MVKAPTGAECRTFLGPGRHAYLPIPGKKVNCREIFRPPQTVKGVLYIRNWVCIFAGDGVDALIVNAEAIGAIGAFWLGKQERPRVNQTVQ